LRTARDARAVRTREALRNALLRLLERKSLEGISIPEICEEASVGYTTFYRHHLSKQSLLNEMAAEEIRQLIALALPAVAATDLRAGAEALFTYVNEHRALWSTLLTGGAEGAMREEFVRISREIAAKRPHANIWPPADIAILLIVSSTIELVSWWLRQREPLAIEEVAEIYETVIVRPAINPRRKASACAKAVLDRRGTPSAANTMERIRRRRAK
jgi:AcrR family transcriptional regulator